MHARWFTYLQRFLFSIQHRAGEKNKVNVLSRRNNLLTILHNSVPDFDQVKGLYFTDEESAGQWLACSEGVAIPKFKIQEGVIQKKRYRKVFFFMITSYV